MNANSMRTALVAGALVVLGSFALTGCSNIPTPNGNGDYRNLRDRKSVV